MANSPITNGWTAASLVPSLMPVTPSNSALATRNVATNPAPAVISASAAASPLIGNLLQSIYGPGYQSLLNTGPYQQPQAPPPDAATIAARAYANQVNNQYAEAQTFDRYQAQIQNQQAALARMNPNNINAYAAAQNQLLSLEQGAPAAGQISQAAALAPSYAPTIIQSANPSQPFTGPTWNPYGASGWISPVQSGVGNGMFRSNNITQNILASGV